MKIIIILIIAILKLIIFSNYSLAATGQEEQLLKAIDDRCGDTWCEGQQDFHFNDLRINGKKATLYYDVADTTNVDKEEDYAKLHYDEATCIFDIQDDDGENGDISDTTLDALTNCFDNPRYEEIEIPDIVPNPFK